MCHLSLGPSCSKVPTAINVGQQVPTAINVGHTCCTRCLHTAAMGYSGPCAQACRLGTACMLMLLCGRLQSSVSLPGSRLASPEAPFSHQQAASLMYGLPPGLMSGASPAGDLHRMQQHIAQLQRSGAPGARQPRRGLSGVPLAQPSGGPLQSLTGAHLHLPLCVNAMYNIWHPSPPCLKHGPFSPLWQKGWSQPCTSRLRS